MPPLLLWLFIALLLVATLVALRLFLARPPQRMGGYNAPLVSGSRAALREVLGDPHSIEGREAELRGDWAAARTAYASALEQVKGQDPADPAVSLKRRVLESKMEELERLQDR
jgi:hypothetical protein